MAKETALPLAFLARMAELLDEDFPPFLMKLNQPAVPALRVNTLKVSVAEFQAVSPWPLAPVPWCSEGFYLDRKANAGTHPFHDAGLYYIQEPSAMAVAAAAAPQPGERILDLCASPGGKATQAAAMLAGEGVLVANEIDRGRADVLRLNLERWGVRNAMVLNESPRRLAERWPGVFDHVIVDAPCSGEGMFRKKEEARFHWSEAHVAGCAIRQHGILNSAAKLVRPGGRLIYATCTFAPEENEGTLWRFLQEHRDFEMADIPLVPGFVPGQPGWADWPAHGGEWSPRERGGEGEESERRGSLQKAVRLWPHKVQGEGHFVAVLQRMDGGQQTTGGGRRTADGGQRTAVQPVGPSTVERNAIEAFWYPLIRLDLPERLVMVRRDGQIGEVFAVPSGAFDTAGLHVVRPGWHLGTLHLGSARPALAQGRFVPSHALAMALAANEVSQRVDEPIGSELAARYLRGETLAGNVIKNHYPKGLRWG